ncbi:SurA N-terminal domain-containing protein [Candidatus Kaiserbacteria bacterium]|nr:SurA N-terminal domain-containing protein [Candidatus Kaiserbacteria bacterium]MCB9812125.1 SurA N-terminal domain-containing protein [Candidatus Nomurabacteria bacterium]
MSENETETKVESTTEAASAPAAEQSTAKKSKKGIIAAILVVALIILGVLYALEKQGRSSTSIFAGFIEYQEANAIVATVNGDNIINAQLDTSINQFTQVAAAQGVDVTSPEIQADIRDQALDVLINTTLLKQAAAERGIDVTDEEVTERLDSITADLGGEEVLVTRMEELGIDAEQLHSDIRDEIVIQELLEVLFAEAAVEVTEEEIAEVYQGAGGEEAGLPAIEEVREQVAAQIRTSKEQTVIDEYIDELKAEAAIEVEGEVE